MKNFNNKLTYLKSNDMIQMRGTVVRRDPLSETKRKIIALEASKVQEDDTCETVYMIAPKELIKLCDIERNGRTYDQIFTEIYELKNKAIAFVNERGKISIESYMDKIEIDRENGSVTYRIPEALLPHFKRYAQFTKLDLLEYMPMRGQYALLLYELLMSWREAGKVYYTLEELRRLLEVSEDAYPKNADFLKRVVHAAVVQINTRITGYKIEYELKYGYRHKTEGVTFFIQKANELQISECESTLKKLEMEGQTNIFDYIANEQEDSTVETTPAPVLAEMTSLLGKEQAVAVFDELGEDECIERLKYAKKNAKSNLPAYFKKVLTGNPVNAEKKGKFGCQLCSGTGKMTVYPAGMEGQEECKTFVPCSCLKNSSVY